MIRIEELRIEIHQLIDKNTSEDELIRIKEEILGGMPRKLVSEEEEARYAIGFQQIKEGKGISLEEFLAKSEARIKGFQ